MTKRNNAETADFLRNREKWIRALVEDARLSHATVRVGVHIALRINAEDREAWPATKTMAKSTGVHVRSVIRAIDAMEETGYLLMARKRNAGNRYWLRFFWE